MVKTIKQKLNVILMLCLTFCMIFNSSLSPFQNVEAAGTKEVAVQSETDFKQAIAYNNGSNHTDYYGETKIILQNNITITSSESLEDITQDLVVDLNGYSITIADSFSQDDGNSNDPALFRIRNNATLTLMDSNPNATTDITYQITKVDAEGNPVNEDGSKQTLSENDDVQATPITQKVTGGYITGHKKSLITINNGSFVMNGGCLYNNGTEADNYDGGAINISNGTVHLNSGYMIANKGSWGGAIRASGSNTSIYIGDNDSSNKEMIISGNVAYRRGGFVYAGSGAQVVMNSGYVTNNNANSGDNKSTSPNDGGGAFFLDDSGTVFTMNGGYVTGNLSEVGGGAGIRASYYTGYDSGKLVQIYIYGGYISSNLSGAEGAGLSVGANCHAYIEAKESNIYFTNNITSPTNDWGGGAIFCADGATITIMEALVSDNTSLGYGGGVAGCSTGRVFDNQSNSAAIFDNHSLATPESVAQGIGLSGSTSDKNEDHTYTVGNLMFLTHGYDDYFCALNSIITNSMLGGGTEKWYGSCDNELVDLTHADGTYELHSTFLMGLTSQANSEDKQKAQNVAKVFVQNNYSATHGGGILCNGYIFFGASPETAEIYDRLSVSATKTVSGANHTDGIFQFEILDEDFNTVSTYTSIDSNGSNGSINANIPFIIDTENDTPTSAGTYSYVYYLREVEGTGSYTYDSTVYRIVVSGNIKSETTLVLTENQTYQQVQVDTHQITNVTVGKGTLTTVNGQTEFTRSSDLDVNKDYTLDLSTGSNHAKTLTFNGSTFTNTYDSTSVSVAKVWDDKDNLEGFRPESIEVELYYELNGETIIIDTQTLNKDNNWAYQWSNLDETINGQTIDYQVREKTTLDKYTTTVKHVDNSWTITNSRDVEYVDVNGIKTWNDGDNQDGLRPQTITIKLLADNEVIDTETVSADENGVWSYAFTDLPKYADGKEVSYTITEDSVDNYETTIDGYNVTNTHVPATTEVAGVKTWDDGNNQDGLRPTSITINLLADGSKVQSTTTNADLNWTYSFTDLPKYSNGNEIEYTIEEVVVAGYSSAVNGYDITNTHIPEVINISFVKTWDDNNNQDGIRPSNITIQLLANGNEVKDKSAIVSSDVNGNWVYTFTNLPKYENGEEIEYTISENTVDGYTLTKYDSYYSDDNKQLYVSIVNTHTPETIDISGTKTWDDADNQDGKRPTSIEIHLHADGEHIDQLTVSPDENGNWTYEFTDLPKYKNNGTEIHYVVREGHQASSSVTANAGYVATYNGYDIVNSYTPGKTTYTVTKLWDDGNNQDGLRSEQIEVQLYANGKAVGETITLPYNGQWTYTWTDLDLMEDGEVITYTADETTVPSGYTKKVEHFEETNSTVITNTHTPETTSIEVTKVWNDGNNQDGLRPTTIRVHLHKTVNGTTTHVKEADFVVSEANQATYKFENLPKYENGVEIIYSIEEDSVEGYTSTIDGYTITNTHVPATTEVASVKTWNDGNNQDGLRPTSITINLLADGTNVQSTTTNADLNWKYEFTNLPKFRDGGTEIVYTINEEAVDGYTKVISGYNITNTHVPETTKVTVTKVWEDNNNQDGKRPTSLVVTLSNGATVTLNEQNNWTASIDNLPKYADGQEISYTWTEATLPEGYTLTNTSVNGTITTLTNSHTPETTKATVTKVWDDANNQDGKRPESLTVVLSNGTEVVLSEENNWTATVENLPKYADGQEITYTWTEGEMPYGYTLTNTSVNGTVTALTNSYTPETTEITVNKVWDDNDNQDGIRPENITIRLYANQTEVKSAIVSVDVNGKWTYTFTNLPKYVNGKEIEYTVKEDQVNGYESETIQNEDGSFTITNIHETEKVSVKVVKVWKDTTEYPENITYHLLANGQHMGTAYTKTVTSETNWGCEWTNLPKYKDGRVIEYTVFEVVSNDYDDTYVRHVDGEGNVTIEVTNTYNPKTISLTVLKEWSDNNNQDGIRPNEITVTLLYKDANGQYQTVQQTGIENPVSIKPGETSGVWFYTWTGLERYDENEEEIQYFVSEEKVEGYETSIKTDDKLNNVIRITNTHEPEMTEISVTKAWNDGSNQDGIRPETIRVHLHKTVNGITTHVQEADFVVGENNQTTYTFKDLPVYENGVKISYTIEEDEVDGYESVITGDMTTGFTITNSHTPETTSVHVTKVWDDANDQDGYRPDSIVLHLHVNGKHKEVQIVTADDNWEYSWTNLPKYVDGILQIYTVGEESVEHYEEHVLECDNEDGLNVSTISQTGYEFEYTLTNKHTPETVQLMLKKTWNDDDDEDGIRPNEITVTLYADEESVNTYTLSESNSWKAIVTDLPKYKDGHEIAYTLVEEEVDGYTSVSTTYTDAIVLENSHTPELTEITGTKTWLDNDNAANERPTSIIVRLYDGVIEVDFQVVTADGNGNWSYTFDNLPKYRDGKLVQYSVVEDAIDNYSVTYVDDSYDLINTYTPGMTSVTVTKLWDDDNNRDAIRPESITVRLYGDGKELEEVTLTKDDQWTYVFTELPITDENGKVIEYTVTEDTVDEYTTEITGSAKEGYVITNTYQPEETSLVVKKVWNDENDKDEIRPETITVNLMADGVFVEERELSETTNWTATFTDLPKYNNGKEIVYTVSEDVVKDYETFIEMKDGTVVITNTHEVEEEVSTKTGDNNNIGLYAGVLGGSAIGLGVLVLLKRKKKETNE